MTYDKVGEVCGRRNIKRITLMPVWEEYRENKGYCYLSEYITRSLNWHQKQGVGERDLAIED